MPELPEIQAHAERLTDDFGGRELDRLPPARRSPRSRPTPRRPTRPSVTPLRRRRPAGQVPAARLRAAIVRRAPHAGRPAQARREAVGQAARRSRPLDVRRRPGAAAHRGGHREEGRRLGARRRRRPTSRARSRSSASVPMPTPVDDGQLAAICAAHSMRLHGLLRDQRTIAGLGRRLANEICHRAKLSPFANAAKLDRRRGRQRCSTPSTPASTSRSPTSAAATT